MGFFKPGIFGSYPKKIKYCLEAHNVGYKQYGYGSCEELEMNMKKGKNIAIVSYNFKFVKIHTFAAWYGEKYLTVNRWSDSNKLDQPEGSLEEDIKSQGAYRHFYIGYILKEKVE